MRYWLWGGLIIWGGFLLFIFRLNHDAVWNDEIISRALISNHSFSLVFNYIINDVHPPLYYLLLKLFCSIGGNSILSIRLFSVLGALALASLGLGPVRRAFGNKTGLLYCGLIFLTPAFLGLAQEGRMYTWAAFFVTGTVFYAYLAATDSKQTDWVKLGLFTLGAAYIHYYALMAVAITYCLLFFWMITKNRRVPLPFWITLGAVLLCYLPWIPVFIRQVAQVRQSYWIPPVSVSKIWDTVCYPFGDKYSKAPQLFIFRAYAFGLAWVLILWGLWRTSRPGVIKKETKLSPGLLLIAIYLLTILAIIAFSYLVRPILEPRYTIVLYGVFVGVIAAGLAAINRKSVFGGALLLWLFFSFYGLVPIYQQRFNGPMEEVTAYLKPKISAQTVFVHFDPDWQTMHAFCYYFPEQKNFIYLPFIKGVHEYNVVSPPGFLGSDLDSFLKDKKDIWVVTSPWDEAAAKTTLKQLRVVIPPRKFQLPYSWFGVEVYQVAPHE